LARGNASPVFALVVFRQLEAGFIAQNPRSASCRFQSTTEPLNVITAFTQELQAGLTSWIAHYNKKRPHSTLAGRTPGEAYYDAPTPLGSGLTPNPVANSTAVKAAA